MELLTYNKENLGKSDHPHEISQKITNFRDINRLEKIEKNQNLCKWNKT